MTERRYSEDEVARIFERAAESQQTTPRMTAPGEGMTLAQLQEIGRDVGIPPALVADAANSLDRPTRPDSRSLLGIPIGVGRTVQLDRRLTQADWERLVVDLRETFDARGTVKADGSFRQWTNGNLQALVEPTGQGDRVRLQTIKGSARSWIGAGLAMLGMSAFMIVTKVLSSGTVEVGALSGAISLAAAGLGAIGLQALRLPAWARLRRQQMEGIASRLALTAPAEGKQP